MSTLAGICESFFMKRAMRFGRKTLFAQFEHATQKIYPTASVLPIVLIVSDVLRCGQKNIAYSISNIRAMSTLL